MRKQRQGYKNPNGRIRRKGGPGEDSSTGATNQAVDHEKNFRDYSHNGSTPVCRLLRNAVIDVFPELGKTNHHHPPKQQSLPNGSLLGQMIRQKYLETRKAYQQQQRRQQISSSVMYDHGGATYDIPLEDPPSNTTKKKRKRKKKKKRPDSIAIGGDEGASVFDSTFPSSSRKWDTNDRHSTDGKSMMSATDHSLEALDEALKIENEKMIELEANREFPLLESLPSDDNFQAEECPSQFIDQIKPQDDDNNDDALRNPEHATPPFENDDTTFEKPTPPSLPEDGILHHDGYMNGIWKEPLKLPFLVNIEGESEGSLSSQNNEKERTKLLFHEWMDQYFLMGNGGVEEKVDDDGLLPKPKSHDWDAFLKFCNQRAASESFGSGIRIQDLISAAFSIDCRICREETLSEIRQIAKRVNEAVSLQSGDSSRRLVMKSSFLDRPIAPNENEVDVESAFDYVALEEGNHVPENKNETNPLDEYDSTDEGILESNVSFVALNVPVDFSKPKKVSNSQQNTATSTQYLASMHCLSLNALTIKQLDGFVSEWLIAGVDEETLADMSICTEDPNNNRDKKGSLVVTSDVDFHRIKVNVMDTQMFYTRSLEVAIASLDEMKDEWRSKDSDLSTERNLVLTGGISMEHCEETCDKFLAESIVPILTGELSIPSHWCAEFQIHLWTDYLSALEKTLKACDKYYVKLEEDLADQNGTLPLIFISARYRSLYRNLAEEKAGVLSKLGANFVKSMESSSMREFYTRWFSGRNKQEDNKDELDDDCRKLIVSLTEWTKVINGMRMKVINDERRKRLETVFDLLRVIVESLGKEYEKVERYFSKEQQEYFTWLLSNIGLAHGVKRRMRLIEMDDIVSLATGVILMWRQVRIMQSLKGEFGSTKSLPLSLHKWMLEERPEVNIELNETSQGNSQVFYSKCWPGIGGRRRVMGMLAGLTYAWLKERCDEWKAEIARQELLTGFELDESSVSELNSKQGGTSSKSSKKKKKKKKKTASPVADDSAPSPTIQEPGGSLDVNEVKTSGEGAEEGQREEIENESVKTSGEGAEEGRREGIENESLSNETVTSVEYDGLDERLHNEEEPSSDEIENYESSIVVRDETGDISAMDFLCGRLFELMKQSESDEILIVPG